MAPRPREAICRLCPVPGSWPNKDIATKAAGILETELTAAGVPNDLKVYRDEARLLQRHAAQIQADAAADSWRRVLAFFRRSRES